MPVEYRFYVEPKGNGLQRLKQLGDNWGQTFPGQQLDYGLEIVRRGIQNIVRYVPGEPLYPIKWTRSTHPEDAGKKPNTAFGYYSRQKKAFFLSQGFGKGTPSKRTRQLIGG